MPPAFDVAPAARAIALVRVVTAGLLWCHGIYRALAGLVQPFGAWLEDQGIPGGSALAVAITAFEVLAPPVWASGRCVRPLSAVHALVLAGGLVMVHYPAGWFVVGGGRNGMEYSVLLLCCLAAVAWASPEPRRAD